MTDNNANAATKALPHPNTTIRKLSLKFKQKYKPQYSKAREKLNKYFSYCIYDIHDLCTDATRTTVANNYVATLCDQSVRILSKNATACTSTPIKVVRPDITECLNHITYSWYSPKDNNIF